MALNPPKPIENPSSQQSCGSWLKEMAKLRRFSQLINHYRL